MARVYLDTGIEERIPAGLYLISFSTQIGWALCLNRVDKGVKSSRILRVQQDAYIGDLVPPIVGINYLRQANIAVMERQRVSVSSGSSKEIR